MSERSVAGLAGSYEPSTPADWSGAPPRTIQEGLDRLAAAVAGGGGGSSGGFYGDGSDGAAVLNGGPPPLGFSFDGGSGKYFPTRELNLTALTIAAGQTLTSTRMRIYVNGTATINGVLEVGPGQASALDFAPCPGGYPGGTGGAATLDGTAGQAMAGESPDPRFTPTGGDGGNGGSGVAAPGGQCPFLNAGGYTLRNAASSSTGVAMVGANSPSFGLPILGWAGSGGGGAGGGTTGAGGNGGDGGSMLLLAAKVIAGTGTLRAKGGDGQAAPAGNGGGGGGGSGGLILLTTTQAIAGTLTLDVSGGAGGAKDGTGQPGNPGGAGAVITVIT